MTVIRLIALVLLLAVPAVARADGLADGDILKLAMPERQFASFLASTTMRTQTFKIALLNLGIEEGAKSYCPALVDALEKHLPAWRSNLVSLYRKHIPEDTLKKATTKDPMTGSLLLAPYMNAVGADMQKDSLPILKEAATEVLTTFFNTAAKAPATEEDKAAHQQEIAKFDPIAFCANYDVPGLRVSGAGSVGKR